MGCVRRSRPKWLRKTTWPRAVVRVVRPVSPGLGTDLAPIRTTVGRPPGPQEKAGFDLAPGGVAVVKARWPRGQVPAAGSHTCLTAAVLNRLDHPVARRHVWEHNNLAQKNLTIVVLPFLVAGLATTGRQRFQLELVRPSGQDGLEASLVHGDAGPFGPTLRPTLIPLARPAPAPADETAILDCGGSPDAETRPLLASDAAESAAISFPPGVEAPFAPGPRSSLPISLRGGEPLLFGLRLKVPAAPDAGTCWRWTSFSARARRPRSSAGSRCASTSCRTLGEPRRERFRHRLGAGALGIVRGHLHNRVVGARPSSRAVRLRQPLV